MPPSRALRFMAGLTCAIGIQTLTAYASGILARLGGTGSATGLQLLVYSTQAPQPPARHSYRFAGDWDYLRGMVGLS